MRMHRNRRLIVPCILLVFALEVFVWSPAFCQISEQAALIEGAKKEGQLLWYVAIVIGDANALVTRFQQKYPFIKVELLRAGSEQLLNRILKEDSTGQSKMDLVNITTITALKKRNLLQAYHSPEFGAYPQQFKDAENYWATLYNIYYVIAYNPRLVPARDAPRNWDDFLDPKWKGKIGMDQEEYEWYAATLQSWGNEKAQKYHRARAKQGVQFHRGHTMISQLIAAGEFPIGISYAHRVESMKKAGAPIDWVKTTDPIFVNVSPVALAAKARNPNSAKLLMDFVLSREGQLILRNLNRISGRSDVEPLVPEMQPGKLKLTAIDPAVAEQLSRYSKEFREIYAQ